MKEINFKQDEKSANIVFDLPQRDEFLRVGLTSLLMGFLERVSDLHGKCTVRITVTVETE